MYKVKFKMIIKSKKGQLQDTTDLMIYGFAMFVGVVLFSMILYINVSEKEEASIEQIDVVNKKAILLNYLSQPLEISGQTLSMKEAILLAVNTNEGSVAETTTISYLNNNGLEARIIVYDKVKYLTKGSYLFWWDNVVDVHYLTADSYIHIPNPSNQEIPEVTVLMYSLS
jgi:hypothetical protein